MFLNEFDDAKKEGFWNLAVQLIKTDGKILPDEKGILSSYKAEMERDDLSVEECSEDIEKIVSDMDLDSKSKRILMYELVSLAFSDELYDLNERETLKAIQKAIGMSDEELSKLADYTRKLSELCIELEDYINE